MKKLYYFLIILILLLTTSLNAKHILIKVIDKDIGIPLEGVKINIKNYNQRVFSDSQGRTKIIIDDNETRIVLIATLIGYEEAKKNIKNITDEITIEMTVTGVLEGKELVIEEDAIGKTDEKLGVSTVMDNDEFKATAEMGAVEDIMSTIKTLPGVSYQPGFSKKFSVRGGHPNEVTAVYDGYLVRYPYHWGGAYSIFNPNIIDSFKFSNGIFSAKNGYAISALIEINSVKPDGGLEFETLLATGTFDVFLQTPVGLKNAGLFIGSRLTYSDVVLSVYESLKNNNTIKNDGTLFSLRPYIRDGYLKWYYKPNKRFEWYVNGFFGSDGIGMYYNSKNNDNLDLDINSIVDFNWMNLFTFYVTGFKILPTDNIFIHTFIGYEYQRNDLDASRSERGETETFKIKDVDTTFNENTNLHGLQSRFDIDITLHERILLSTGIGSFLILLLMEAPVMFIKLDTKMMNMFINPMSIK